MVWKTLLVLGACLVCGMAAMVSMTTNTEWQAFKTKYNRTYGNLNEEIRRYTIWQQNREFIISHNKKADQGEYTFRVGMNHFGDWTRQEYLAMLSDPLLSRDAKKPGAVAEVPDDVTKLPPEVDWNVKGYVTPVRSQAMCGACYAFSSSAALESQHIMATGKHVVLSVQNIIDCSRKQGNQGCYGGLMDYAFEYIRVNGGIDTESSYPFEGQDGTSCRFTRASVGANLTGYKDIPKGNEFALQKAVAEVGPVATGVNSETQAFEFYTSGVISVPDCDPNNLCHSLLVTGYGTLNGVDYWDNKNSWGPEWGDKGYVKIARNKNNMCGIASLASYPVL